ncbi:sulfur carrier protein ThiS [Clostridium formicaceticum]|jgi:sulfur carrier protein|uniref:Sulfur carrier protein ThiS n=1 Tax=Clostridium formicaceticum TaxID=1497 RepID=A0AAC9RQL2_9CLOT|nr:sulfur carrier protein ThiS [Clostridium formicaceticum]AOY77858.1 thiamine biosynthesis protein ThiS [Clostridium formicaceticum]ARE88475.1 sulfur carrier protein ThiS [Clostridium formicaceticum]
MEVTLNKDKVSIAENTTILELLHEKGYNDMIAIFINGKQLLQKEYENHVLKENDIIKVIRILGGG